MSGVVLMFNNAVNTDIMHQGLRGKLTHGRSLQPALFTWWRIVVLRLQKLYFRQPTIKGAVVQETVQNLRLLLHLPPV